MLCSGQSAWLQSGALKHATDTGALACCRQGLSFCRRAGALPGRHRRALSSSAAAVDTPVLVASHAQGPAHRWWREWRQQGPRAPRRTPPPLPPLPALCLAPLPHSSPPLLASKAACRRRRTLSAAWRRRLRACAGAQTSEPASSLPLLSCRLWSSCSGLHCRKRSKGSDGSCLS